MTQETIDAEATVVEPTPPEPVQVSDVIRSDRLMLANDTVKNHIIAATGTSLIPIPGADIAALVGVQIDMARSLCKVYEVPFKEKLVRSLLTSLVGGVGTMATLHGLSSLAKAVPVIGQISGAAAMSVTAAAMTYGAGRVLIEHFEVGGTIDNFDPVKFKTLFKAKVKEGAEVVKSLQPNAG